MVETPVLFETFVRVDYARQVWGAIKVAQPKKLYFYSNKGRAERVGEIECNNEIRSWVKEIDWDCELHIWFRDECVDVYTSLRGAIDWVFKHEEQAIILEDDCLPINDFFKYCEELLILYKNNDRVMFIGGSNFQDGLVVGNSSYYFSNYCHVWGWASWRRLWDNYSFDLSKESISVVSNVLSNRFLTNKQKCYWESIFERMIKDPIDTWDYQLVYSIWANNGVAIIPNRNLVSNIGFGQGATHTVSENSPCLMTGTIL